MCNLEKPLYYTILYYETFFVHLIIFHRDRTTRKSKLYTNAFCYLRIIRAFCFSLSLSKPKFNFLDYITELFVGSLRDPVWPCSATYLDLCTLAKKLVRHGRSVEVIADAKITLDNLCLFFIFVCLFVSLFVYLFLFVCFFCVFSLSVCLCVCSLFVCFSVSLIVFLVFCFCLLVCFILCFLFLCLIIISFAFPYYSRPYVFPQVLCFAILTRNGRSPIRT